MLLGYKRLSSQVRAMLRNHLRAAIRRGIVETGGYSYIICPGARTMADYSKEEIGKVLRSVTKKWGTYERKEVIRAIANHLGFSRVTEAIRQQIDSALKGAKRQGVIDYYGGFLWRKK